MITPAEGGGQSMDELITTSNWHEYVNGFVKFSGEAWHF